MDRSQKIVLAVIIPAYNQETTIERVIEDWVEVLSGLGIVFHLHVYNDGSTDQTGAILDRLADRHASLRMHHNANIGHGPTIQRGYRAITYTTWILQVDSDDEVSAKKEVLWRHRHAYDLVIANRTGRLASPARRMFTRIAGFLIHVVYGRSVNDVNVPYRLMRASTFLPCFQQIPDQFFAPNLAITGYAALRQVKTLEIDFPHRSVSTGEVTRSNRRILKGVFVSSWQLLRFRFKLRADGLKALDKLR